MGPRREARGTALEQWERGERGVWIQQCWGGGRNRGRKFKTKGWGNAIEKNRG